MQRTCAAQCRQRALFLRCSGWAAEPLPPYFRRVQAAAHCAGLDSWVGGAPGALRACGAPAAPAAVRGAQRGAQAGRMEPVAEYTAG